jgi:hypothetical protein
MAGHKYKAQIAGKKGGGCAGRRNRTNACGSSRHFSPVSTSATGRQRHQPPATGTINVLITWGRLHTALQWPPGTD